MFSIGYDVWTFRLLENASSSRSPTRHLLLTRESRFSTLTSDDVAVCGVEFLGNKKHSEVFQFKSSVGTKDGNFVPFLLAV